MKEKARITLMNWLPYLMKSPYCPGIRSRPRLMYSTWDCSNSMPYSWQTMLPIQSTSTWKSRVSRYCRFQIGQTRQTRSTSQPKLVRGFIRKSKQMMGSRKYSSRKTLTCGWEWATSSSSASSMCKRKCSSTSTPTPTFHLELSTQHTAFWFHLAVNYTRT